MTSIDTAIRLLIQTTPARAVEALARTMPEDDAREIVRQAQIAVTRAAAFDRVEEVGLAKMRLERLYEIAMGEKDHKQALAIQKEINRLCGLINQPTIELDADGDPSAGELARIRDQVIPLGLASPSDPLAAHIREMIALLITHPGYTLPDAQKR